MTSKNNTLVLGGSGQLGTALVVQLARKGEPSRAPRRNQWDLSLTDEVERHVESYAPTTIINAAAYNDVDGAETADGADEAWLLNVKLPGVLAGACAKRGIRFVHVSTDYVFDGRSDRPYTETDPTGPLQVYGRGKLEGEQAVLEADATALVVRTSTVYGPSRRAQPNFVTRVLAQARRHEKVEMVCGSKSSPTYAPDLAAAIMELLACKAEGLVHFANDEVCTRYEFAAEILRRAGLHKTTQLRLCEDRPGGAPRPKFSVLETSRFRALTGTQPRPWRVALTQYLSWIEANRTLEEEA